jgi:transposase
MEAPLSICTKKEMRGVIRFLFAEGFKPVEIVRRMQAQYSDSCLSHSKIYEWTDHFKKGRTSVCDEERSGRPSTSRNENSIQAVERLVRENRPITVDDTAEASI